jgi:hypothetical protein
VLGQGRLTKAERRKYGSTIHWTLGATAGAAYALRLTPGPKAFPWQTHARGIAGHLSFAAAADAALRVLEPIA